MALHLSGEIHFQNIVDEFKTIKPIKFSEMYAGGGYVPSANKNVPSLGEISLSDFYGATSAFVWVQNYTVDTFNANTDVMLNMAGWDGETPVMLTINIASGVVISANTTGNTALLINNLPQGSQVIINNSGFIIGMGGAGGAGRSAGGAGGTALLTKVPTAISNLGTISGGGGGGGGSAAATSSLSGGGKSGRANSAGTQQGTFNSAGSGYISSYISGGAGGDWGANGARTPSGNVISAGGAGGLAVQGNSFITWQSVGTIAGATV